MYSSEAFSKPATDEWEYIAPHTDNSFLFYYT